MLLIIHMFNTSVIPNISLDHYLNHNLYILPNMQNMRFFCWSVYVKKNRFALRNWQDATYLVIFF